MKNKNLVTIVMAGLSLWTASHAMAQSTNNYQNLDLLLDFRNATTPADSDITVDLGNVSTFISAVAALPGGTAVLDSGSGFATSSYPTQFAFSDLTDLLGAPGADNEIGFSANAADAVNGTGLLYLTRIQTTAGLTPPAHPSQQQSLSTQSQTGTRIHLIGLETENSDVTPLPSSGNNAVSYPSSDTDSYQKAAQGSTANVINYGGFQNTAAGAGGLMEQLQTGSATIYEALWKVPVSGTGSDTYEGYFTFKPTGELDFTTGSSTPSVPNLSVSQGANSVILSWPNTGTYSLVESSVVTGPWVQNTVSTNTSNGTNYVTITSSTGNEFFRLRYP